MCENNELFYFSKLTSKVYSKILQQHQYFDFGERQNHN